VRPSCEWSRGLSSRVTVSVLFGGSAAPLRGLTVGRGGSALCLGETNAASKREEDDYEIIRGNAAAGAWHESRLRRQALHQQATPRGHELVKYESCAQLPCGHVMYR
jgi:hypothetical protein